MGEGGEGAGAGGGGADAGQGAGAGVGGGGAALHGDILSALTPACADTATDTRTATDFNMSKENVNGCPDGADEKMLKGEEMKLAEKVDSCDVKFVSAEKNGDAKIDIMDVKQTFTGLTKEELMKYCNDPFWVRLRWVMFVAFWLIWIGMLVGAIIIIVAAPKCSPPAPKTWWQEGPMMELTPAEDEPAYASRLSDLSEKLPTLESLKIKGVYVAENPVGSAYAIVNPSPAIESAFKDLAEKAKKSGISLVVDLTPNFVEKTHEWFVNSEKRIEPYTDYFVWADSQHAGDAKALPSNWISTLNEPAWSFSDERKQFYLHQFNKSTPDLNFRNPDVINEFNKVIKYWLGLGASGIRLSKAKYLLVDQKFTDEAVNHETSHAIVLTQYDFYAHSRTTYQEGLGGLLAQWKNTILEHTNGEGILTLKEDLDSSSIESLKSNGTMVVDLPKSSRGLLQSSLKPLSAKGIHESLQGAFGLLGEDAWPSWQYNSHDDSISSELEIFAMLLPGTPIVNLNQIKKESANASEIVAKEEYEALVKLRALPAMKYGSYGSHLLQNNTVIGFTRLKSGNPGYLILFNPGETQVRVDATSLAGIPPELTVDILSKNYKIPDVGIKNKLHSQNVTLTPRSAIVLTYVPKQDE